jgi:hypothetical protein
LTGLSKALLTGLAQCWECYQHDGRAASLRGSTGGRHATRYYRCATLHNRYIKKSRRTASVLHPQADTLTDDLLARHTHSSLRAEQMEAQLQGLIEKLVIPTEWHEAVMAYYLSGEGLSEFEREGYNLRASLKRYRQLYLNGHMDQAEFDTQALHLGRQLQGLKPSASPEAQEILPHLQDFPQLWMQLTNGEKRNLLKMMFQVLYFDSQGELREAVAHAPFKELLGLS